MSTDRGDSVDPNDPYRPAQPDEPGSTPPPGYGPGSSGHEASPSGSETPGTGPDEQVPTQSQPYAPYSEQPYGQQPYGQPPYPQPYGQRPAYGPRPPSAGTDGFAIAALVTGILLMAIVPIVLGIVALNRISRSGQEGKGLAIAGIVLGAISAVGWLLAIVGVIAFFTAYETGGFETYGLGALLQPAV